MGFHSPCIDDAVVRDSCREAVSCLLQKHQGAIHICASQLNALFPSYSIAEWKKLITNQLDKVNDERYGQEVLWRTLIKKIEVSLDGRIKVSPLG